MQVLHGIADLSFGTVGLALYQGHLDTVLSVTPSLSASCFCVRPSSRRAAAIRAPRPEVAGTGGSGREGVTGGN